MKNLFPKTEHYQQQMATITIPESTRHLYEAIFDHEIVEASEFHKEYSRLSKAANADLYPLPEECQKKGNPEGKLIEGVLTSKEFYPGIDHPYWIYVPAAYQEKEEAGLLVFLDGQFLMPGRTEILTMIDNLIADKKIPVCICLFIGFGTEGPGQPYHGFKDGANNRSLEYDTPSDKNASFLCEEVFPQLLNDYNIASDPKQHVIIGVSSSGIGSFTAAWFRPDVFGCVYNAIPSFVNIRGGYLWPSVLRIEDKKDIKVFTVDSANDLDNIYGNWLINNYDVAYALEFKGYEHRFYVSEAGHSFGPYIYMMPSALQWLFFDKETQKENVTLVNYDNLLVRRK